MMSKSLYKNCFLFFQWYLLCVILEVRTTSVIFSEPSLVAFNASAKAPNLFPAVPDVFYGFGRAEHSQFSSVSNSESGDFAAFGVYGPGVFDVTSSALPDSDSFSSVRAATEPTWNITSVKNVPLFAAVPVATKPGSPLSARTYRNLGFPQFASANSSGWSHAGVSTFSLDGPEHSFLVSTNDTAAVHFVDIPAPGVNISAVGSQNRVPYSVVQLRDGSYVASVCLCWNGYLEKSTPDGPRVPTSIVSFTSADGYTFRYSAPIANAADFQWSTFGPNEHDMELLADGQTVMAALRMDGDANCNTGTYAYYYQSYSRDGGQHWTKPTEITGAGCVRPKLRLLTCGTLLMTGGRLCVEDTKDIVMWVNRDGMAGASGGDPKRQWTRISLTNEHNQLWSGDKSFLFDRGVNASDTWQTLSYTSIIATGSTSAVVFYQKFFNDQVWPPWPSATFMMHLDVKDSDETVHAPSVELSGIVT